jgi:DNA-binding transcriptional MerR regulator
MKDLEMKKLYYSISEVSRMVDLEQYVLRYWEREFSQLRPQKNRAGNRIYTERDIELIKLIKRLTREDRYTISGARQVLEQLTYDNGIPVLPEEYQTLARDAENGATLQDDLNEVRRTLVQLLDLLKGETTV